MSRPLARQVTWVADPDLDDLRCSTPVQTCARDIVRLTYHLWKSQQCRKQPGQDDLVSLGDRERNPAELCLWLSEQLLAATGIHIAENLDPSLFPDTFFFPWVNLIFVPAMSAECIISRLDLSSRASGLALFRDGIFFFLFFSFE